ncbi:MAG: hypothetical protein KKD94_06120 [Nanoarchaeota archaeon]|nr:hypothetical protein [Nanoarchaeota archaeon]
MRKKGRRIIYVFWTVTIPNKMFNGIGLYEVGVSRFGWRNLQGFGTVKFLLCSPDDWKEESAAGQNPKDFEFRIRASSILTSE